MQNNCIGKIALQEEYEQVIEEHEQSCCIAQRNSRDCESQIQAIKYENVELQGEIHAKEKQL